MLAETDNADLYFNDRKIPESSISITSANFRDSRIYGESTL